MCAEIPTIYKKWNYSGITTC